MEQGKAHQILQDSWFGYGSHLKNESSSTLSHLKNEDQWLKVDDDGGRSSHGNSMVSEGSSVSLSSCDTTDDASSSLPSSSSNSSGSLYDLSELMVQLPIKRGLSKFYQGKSESFTSLSRVASVEDLAKKTSPCRRKMKSSKSSWGNSAYKPYILPKPIISKAKKLDTSKRGSFISNSRPWLAPAPQKKME